MMLIQSANPSLQGALRIKPRKAGEFKRETLMNLSNEKAYLDLLEQISGTYIEGRTRATQSQIVRRPVARGGAMSALRRHG